MKLNFAENLRTMRRSHNLTQEQLADRLAVSVQTVSRWENEITYPDMELMPVIAELFDTSVDALLGVTEAVKARQKDEFWQRSFRTDDDAEHTEIFREAHRAFPRDLDFSTQLCERILYSEDPMHNPDALREMRMLVEDVLENSRERYQKERVVLALAQAEDDDRFDALMDQHASGENMQRDRILVRRYHYRNEDEKAHYLTQQQTAAAICDVLLDGLYDPSDDMNRRIAVYRRSFAVLDTLTGCVNPNPVSGDGVPDVWCRIRIHLGNRLAAWYAKKGDRDAVYEILDDNVTLFEKVCALREGTELTCRTPGLSLLKYRVKHSFDVQPNCAPDFGKRYKTTYFEPINPPIKADTHAFFPTTYTWALTDRECWNEFDCMRDEPHFQALAERMLNAIETRDPE